MEHLLMYIIVSQMDSVMTLKFTPLEGSRHQ